MKILLAIFLTGSSVFSLPLEWEKTEQAAEPLPIREPWKFHQVDNYFANGGAYYTRAPLFKELEGKWFLRKETRNPDKTDYLRQMRTALIDTFLEPILKEQKKVFKKAEPVREGSMLSFDWKRDGSWAPRLVFGHFYEGKRLVPVVKVNWDLLGVPMNIKTGQPVQFSSSCVLKDGAYSCETGFKYRQQSSNGEFNTIVDVKQLAMSCRYLIAQDALLCSMRWQYKAFYWPDNSSKALLDALNWEPGTRYEDAPYNEASYYALYLRK